MKAGTRRHLVSRNKRQIQLMICSVTRIHDDGREMASRRDEDLRGLSTALTASIRADHNNDTALMIKQELFRVDECPENIFIGGGDIVLVGFDISQGDVQFFRFGRSRKGGPIKFLHMLFV